jgi:hypothetical protein
METRERDVSATYRENLHHIQPIPHPKRAHPAAFCIDPPDRTPQVRHGARGDAEGVRERRAGRGGRVDVHVARRDEVHFQAVERGRDGAGYFGSARVLGSLLIALFLPHSLLFIFPHSALFLHAPSRKTCPLPIYTKMPKRQDARTPDRPDRPHRKRDSPAPATPPANRNRHASFPVVLTSKSSTWSSNPSSSCPASSCASAGAGGAGRLGKEMLMSPSLSTRAAPRPSDARLRTW